MRVVQATWGVFHHFELARELDRHGILERVYSTGPWFRLKREGLSRSKIRTFPWIQMAQHAAGRCSDSVARRLAYANTILFDKWLNTRVPHAGVDALIGLSGAGLETGRRLQQEGGVFICDRGSTHLRYQERLLNEEFARWGVEAIADRTMEALYDREVEMYRAADAITVPSSVAARSFAEEGIPKEKVHVIPYGVRLERFHPVAEPAADRFEVLFVGQVSLRKGIPYLLEAFAQLRDSRKRLRVVGAIQPNMGPVLARLPPDQVEFLGSQPQTEVIRYMSSSHVMVLPSIEEGLALVQGQAMACGCPVIASTNTGSEDLFTDGVEGFIVPIRDVDALRGRMQQLADDSALWACMRERALMRVHDLGGWRDYGDRWVSLLERLVRPDQTSAPLQNIAGPGRSL